MTKAEAARLVAGYDPRQPGWPWLGDAAEYAGPWGDCHVFGVPLTAAPPDTPDNTMIAVVYPDGKIVTGSPLELVDTLPGYAEWAASLPDEPEAA